MAPRPEQADLEGVQWVREAAPSAALRKGFGHKPERRDQFRERYFDELRSNSALETIRETLKAGPVSLVYGAKIHNQAAAPAEHLTSEAEPAKKRGER